MDQTKTSFAITLKPLTIATRFTVGISLNFNEKKGFIGIRFFTLILGFLFLISNILFNGPRGINITNFDYMKRTIERQGNLSYYLYFDRNPEMLLQFVFDATSIMFWVAIPLIQLIFFITIMMSQKWQDLVKNLRKVEKEMKLSSLVFRNCHKDCISALFLLILVS